MQPSLRESNNALGGFSVFDDVLYGQAYGMGGLRAESSCSGLGSAWHGHWSGEHVKEARHPQRETAEEIVEGFTRRLTQSDRAVSKHSSPCNDDKNSGRHGKYHDGKSRPRRSNDDHFCHDDDAGDFKGDPIIIGLEAPLTGSQQSTGLDMWRGALLAVEQINQQGGILGRKVVLIPADDMADPNRALPVAEQLEELGAEAVVGPFNSSVGVLNLPYYIDNGIVPIHLTSTDETTGLGVTIQPKTSQIAPLDSQYITSLGVKSVSILVDPSNYTQTIANDLTLLLGSQSISVQQFTIEAGLSNYDFAVSNSLAAAPDLVYVSTYYPEGALIAESLSRLAGPDVVRFMGLPNVDQAFVKAAGVDVSQTLVFSGVPSSPQLPTATDYVSAYEARFGLSPDVWGAFTYDSVYVYAQAVAEAGKTNYKPVLANLLQTSDYSGQTGVITIDPLTGNRVDVPLYILEVNQAGVFVPKTV